MKATFKAVIKREPWDRHAWEHTDLLYEYRGHEYIVTKHNNGYAGKSLTQQHREEQARIDELIEHENDPIPEWKYKGSADEAIDMFLKYLA